jgi:hypothetical protein
MPPTAIDPKSCCGVRGRAAANYVLGGNGIGLIVARPMVGAVIR